MTCKCGESKRVRISVVSGGERAPKPVWSYRCNACGHEWVVDENKETQREDRR